MARIPFTLRGGSVVALPTPFRANRLDEQALAALCTRHIEAGTHGIVVCGTTGEAPALSHEEQRRVIEVAVAAAGERMPVIAGAAAAGTEATVALARQAEEAGAAALLCGTPCYVRPTQEGVRRHMRAIHDAVRLPIILYDVPARTACALADETIVSLSRLDRIVGLKDAAGDVARTLRLRSAVPSGFLLLSGDDATQDQYRGLGGVGCISVTANIAPRLCAEMHNAWDRGEPDRFARIAEILKPLNRALFVESNPIPVKYAMSLMGLLRNELRLPLTPLQRDHEATVTRAVEQILTLESASPVQGTRNASRPQVPAQTAHLAAT